MAVKLQIVKSHLPSKKYDAIFTEKNIIIKVVPFGAAGYSDYTINESESRRDAYIKRHSKTEHFNNPLTAGSLSRWILWGESTDMKTNIREFKKMFGLK